MSKLLDDDGAEPQVEEQQNYSIVFTRKIGKTMRLIVANGTNATTVLKDPETAEEIIFLFAIVTDKNDDGDLKLAHMCHAMQNANVFFHTYE
jgi:hypothetical protein